MSSPQMFIICTFQLFPIYWDKSLFGLGVQKILFFCFSWFFFCVCPLHSWYMLENLIYDEQKWQVVRRFTAVTKLEKLLTKYHIFHSLIQEFRGSKQKYDLSTRYNISNFKFSKDAVVCCHYFRKNCFQIKMK